MTIWDLYVKESNDAEDNNKPLVELDSYVGLKVRCKVYEGGREYWSKAVYTVTGFDDDVCGDGCCHGFSVDGGDPQLSYHASQLEVVDEQATKKS